jgi:hypothetical protein
MINSRIKILGKILNNWIKVSLQKYESPVLILIFK